MVSKQADGMRANGGLPSREERRLPFALSRLKLPFSEISSPGFTDNDILQEKEQPRALGIGERNSLNS